MSAEVAFCRPVTNENQVHLYIDSKVTDSTFEAGTAVYPYSNIAYAFLEVFNS